MMRLSQLTAPSLHRDGDGPRLQTDRDRGASLRRHRDGLAPPGLLEVAEGADDTDELGIGLELAAILPRLGRLELEFLTSHQLAAQGGLLAVEQRKEVRAIERGDRLELVDAHDNGRRAARAIGVDVRLDVDRAPQ